MCDLLVLSCDKYQDTHKIFFDLKRKYWKDCPYDTYLLTETIDSPYAKTIKKQGEWTKRVREALEELSSDYVIIMLDDFFIRDYVKQDKIDQIKFNDNTAVYNFEVDYNNCGKGFRLRKNKEPYLLSCQPSMWNRLKLISLLQRDLNPWQWETQTLDSQYEFYINVEDLIIDIGYYNYKQWSIKQGKWCAEIVPFFKKENIQIDYSLRGFYDMQLSIIIPMYNTTMLTKSLLDKLRPQLTNECELIVVDDGSTEDTSILGDIYHKKNGGVSSARNYGLSKAQGKYVVFIDSDDMITDDYIKTILSVKEDYDYCYFGWKSNGRIKGEFFIPIEPPTWNTCVWNCIYKRDLIGSNRFDETKQIAEDEDFNKRVRKGKRTNINKILYDYNSSREDSLTRKFAAGLITPTVDSVIRTQILFYQKAVGPIGGIEKSIYERLKALKDKYDIVFMYKDGDGKQLNRYRKLVKCIKFEGQKIECNKYISCSAYDNIADNVLSYDNFYVQEIHADYKALGWKYKKHSKTNVHIAVSELARKTFLELYPNETCDVIYNLSEVEIPHRVLNLVSATRLSYEKGYDRMKILAKELNKKNIPFTWNVFTTDRPNEEIDGFIFRQATFDVKDYIANADYLVQLSNTESWCYALVEALELGVPVITTDIPVLKELGVEDKVNGFILPFDMTETRVDEIYNTNLKGFKYIKRDSVDQWIKQLGKMTKKDNYIFEETKEWTVKPLFNYFDNVEQRQVIRGIPYTVYDKRRLEILLGDNENRSPYVELIE